MLFPIFISTKWKIRNISSEIQMLMSSPQPLPSLNLLVIQPLVTITAIKSTIAVPEMGNWLYIHVISA